MNKVFIIGGRSYNVSNPTMKKLSLAGEHLEKEIENQVVKVHMKKSLMECPRKRFVKPCHA